MIFIAGGTIAFFFELLLLGKKSKSLSDKILTFWMFILGVHLFLYYFYTKGIYLQYPHVLAISIPLPLIHGPLLFLYTGFLTSYFTKWKQKYLLHFLPVIFFSIYYFDFFISAGEGEIDFTKNYISNSDTVRMLFYPAILISGFSYIFLAFLLFRKHRGNILNNLSYSNEKNNLHWLRNLLSGMLVIWLVVLLGGIVLNSSLKDSAIYFSASLFVVFIGFFGLRQGNIFMNLPNGFLPEKLTAEDQRHYSKSGLKDNAIAESFFKSLKVEYVYHQSYRTFKESELSVFEYIETWYNVNNTYNT